MSADQITGSNGVAQEVYYPAEDLDSYLGCAVRVTTGSLVGPCSLTNQATTQGLFGVGVLRNSGKFESGGTGQQVEIWQWGVVLAKAGTGGVSVGSTVVPEYAASGTDRGRFIAIADATDLADGDYTWGTALTAASEDGLFRLQLNRQQVWLDGTGA